MIDKRELFEKTPVPKALATLAMPTIISQLISMIYNLADTFFIGLSNNPSQTAASSVSFTLLFMLNCLPNLFGVGGGSLISRLLGEKKDKDAGGVASFAFYCTLISAAVYSLAVLAFMDPLLNLLGATSGSIVFARQYAFWVVVLGGIPTALSMTMSHLLRSEGLASKASIGLGMGGVLNIILDPIFMFLILKPGEEVRGAAIATMISNIIVFLYFVVVYLRSRKTTVISLNPRKALLDKRYVNSVLAVGIPSALGSFLACLSNIVINNLAAGYELQYGDVPVASIGIAKKIDMLPMNVGFGLCQGMMPLVAYNFASGDHKRMRAFSRLTRTVAMAFAAFCIVLFQLFAPQIAGVFNRDGATMAMSTDFLRILCLSVPFMLFNLQISFTFQAMGMGKQSLILSSLRQGLINIPLLFVMNGLFGLYGIVWTQLVSDVITAAISYAVYHSSLKKIMTDKPTEAEIPSEIEEDEV
ncbi:MAG: MATE family efflux transporter [Clostridia bacterium]|nr:MATE family efflux transporter [Clostridia bacterium]